MKKPVVKLTPDERAKKVEEAMRYAWSSMESHFKHTYGGDEKPFDKECVKEYARLMVILSELY
jgi:hypothetical protein